MIHKNAIKIIRNEYVHLLDLDYISKKGRKKSPLQSSFYKQFLTYQKHNS